MAKILAPNKDYNGVSASVNFENGIGETDDADLITWFKENGYKVEKPAPKAETKPKTAPKAETKPKT